MPLVDHVCILYVVAITHVNTILATNLASTLALSVLERT